MFPQIDSEVGINPKQSRRKFLGRGTGAMAGLILISKFGDPQPAFAEESSWAIKSLIPHWYPYQSGQYSPGGVRLMTIYEPDGPAHRFDMDWGTNSRDELERISNKILNETVKAKQIIAHKIPEERSSWGLCHAVAASNIYLGYQVASGKISREHADKILASPHGMGLMAILFAGAIADRPHNDNVDSQTEYDRLRELNNDYFVEKVRSELSPSVIRVRNGLPGAWFYSLIGREGDDLTAVNFNTKIKLKRNQIITSHNAVLPSEALTKGIRPEFIEETRGYRFTEQNLGITEERILASLGI